MIQEIFDFLTTPGNGERITGLVITGLIVLGVVSVLIYHLFSLFVDLIQGFFRLFKFERKERIVKVPEYITPPINKEMDKYMSILKKILNEHNSLKLKL